MTTQARKIIRQPAIDVMAKAMSEEQLQEAITGMLDAYKIRWWHDNDPIRNQSGLPDLIVIGLRVEWWELKSQTGRVRPDQNAFLSDLVRAGAKARVVRPIQLLDGSVQTWVRGLR
jgi:hypothetical protein